MMNSKFKTGHKKRVLTGGAALLMLAACATTPEPVPVAPPAAEPVAEIPIARPVSPPEFIPVEPPVQMAEPVIQEKLPLAGSADDFIYQSGGDSRVYFAYDQYDLSSSAREVLRHQADWLKTYPKVNAVIEGNADERGTREYNLALAARRANSAKDFLVGQGVNPSRLTSISFGKERPIDPRSNAEGWARNRNSHTNISVSSIVN